MDNTKKSTVFEFLRDYDKYDSIFSDIIPDFISNNDFDFVNELFWMQFSEILSFMESVLFICGFNKNQNFGS